jgi:hypothetical protein
MVAFCIPWREAPKRIPLLTTVLDEIESRYEWPIYFSDPEGPIFSRARAINRAAVRAFENGHEVVVINDADTLFQAQSLETAVARTMADKKSRLPYDQYLLMDQGDTNRYVATREVGGMVYDGACSGVLVIHRDTWSELGGFDERYIGWGAEDVEFAIRHQFERVPGKCWGMWHEPDERGELTRLNMERLRTENPGCG